MLLILADVTDYPSDLLADLATDGAAVVELPETASPTLAAGLLLALAPEPCRVLTADALRLLAAAESLVGAP